MTKFRLAVLECDVPFPGVVELRGSYGDQFRALLSEGMRGLPGGGAEIELTKWDVVKAHVYPVFEDFDGLMISGSSKSLPWFSPFFLDAQAPLPRSPRRWGAVGGRKRKREANDDVQTIEHTAFDNEPWIIALIDYLHDFFRNCSKPVVGICFGHQIIARTLGGVVEVSPGGWENSVTKIDLSEAGRQFFGVPSIVSNFHTLLYLLLIPRFFRSRLTPMNPQSMHQTHRDAVTRLPRGVSSIGGSDRCGVHGMYQPGRILSFQGHPEFDEETMSLILKGRYSIGVFTKDMYDDGMARVDWPHSGKMLATKICGFFLGGAAASRR